MTRRRRDNAKKWNWTTIGVCAFIAVSVVAVTGGILYQNSQTSSTAARATPLSTTPPVLKPAAAAPLPPLAAPPGSKALFFGDSWTQGYGVVPESRGFAYLVGQNFGWDFKVDGKGGTGFQNRGVEGAGTYIERARRLPVDPGMRVVFLQGGLNDQRENFKELDDIVIQTIAVMREKFPNASIVLVGPTATSVPPNGALSAIDGIFYDVANQHGLHYISPLTFNWINESNLVAYIDPNKKNHPNADGHGYIAQRFIDAVREIS